jgi:two-component system, OmpR family, heavy metal sensor histidine kinase CusS
MTFPVAGLKAGIAALRRSLTAQISLAIAFVSVLMILLFGKLLDEYLAQERRQENELQLIANLAFLRDDLEIAGNDPAAVAALVQRVVRRTPRLDVAVLDDRGNVLAEAPRHAIPAEILPQRVVDADVLPRGASFAELEILREQLGPVSSVGAAVSGTRLRLVRGRISLPSQAGVRPSSLQLVLAIETRPTRLMRERNRQTLAAALWTAAALASLFGLWIAHRIVVSVRRLGATASHIGAHALNERLAVAETPTELVESALAFNQMLDRLQSSFERLAAFSSDLAHDLRTPIGNLLGEAQVVLSRPRSSEEYRSALESAVEEYERLSRMITNMLFLARADDQAATLEPKAIDARAVLERVKGYFEILAEEKELSIEVYVQDDGAPALWADETLLLRALSNLVSNALQHADRKSTVRLAVASGGGGHCTLDVSNEGPVIPQEHQSRIFDRFYRVDASRSDSASGSGLGLAIVRSIMAMHGGSVSVHSIRCEPTVFTLSFPAASQRGG